MFDPHFQAVAANGRPESGAQLFFYRAGTSSLIPIYKNSDATTPHTNPVVANASGAFPAIFIAGANPFKIILKTSAGVTIDTIDQIPVGTSIGDVVGPLASVEGRVPAFADATGKELYQSQLKDVLFTAGSTLISGADYNFLAGGESYGGAMIGGRADRPNHIGKKFHRQIFPGDGLTYTFVVTAPFIINAVPWHNIDVIFRDRVTGIWGLPQIIGDTVSVSGYGTSTISVGIYPQPSATQDVYIFVKSEDDVDYAQPLNTIVGYDNLIGSAVSNRVLSDHSFVPSGGGHNMIAGGAYNYMYGSFGFSTGIFNTVNSIEVGAYCWVFGMENFVDGTGSGAVGERHEIRGNYTTAFGRRNKASSVSAAFLTGQRGEAYSYGDRVHGGGLLTDTVFGLNQYRRFVMNRVIEGATNTPLFLADGVTTLIPVGAKSAQLCRVDIVGLKSDTTKAAAFSVSFLLTKGSGGSAYINGSTDAVAATPIGTIGSPSYSAMVLPSGDRLMVFVTGAAAETVSWTATVEMTQVRTP